MTSIPNDTMIVMYKLAPGQDQASFEHWLREVDLPGYEKVSSMKDPVYYRAEKTLEGEAPPYRYVVAIRSLPGDEVDEEMAGAEWESFVADFENRTRTLSNSAQHASSAEQFHRLNNSIGGSDCARNTVGRLKAGRALPG